MRMHMYKDTSMPSLPKVQVDHIKISGLNRKYQNLIRQNAKSASTNIIASSQPTALCIGAIYGQ